MEWTGYSDYQAMKPYIVIAEKTKADAMKTFEAKQEGLTYEDAISMMICNYGGVARKQAVTAVNAFYFNELNKLVTESINGQHVLL